MSQEGWTRYMCKNRLCRAMGKETRKIPFIAPDMKFCPDCGSEVEVLSVTRVAEK